MVLRQHGLLWNPLCISVVADDVAERTRLNSTQGFRLQSFSHFRSTMGKEESVSSHESLELDGDDAGEGRTNKAIVVSGLLSKTPAEAVNLIDAGIDISQVAPVFSVDLVRSRVHRGEWVEPAEGPHAVVGRDSMVATSLDVSSRQVVTKIFGFGVTIKQEVGQSVDHCSVGRRAVLLSCLLHLAEPLLSRLVTTKDKVFELEEMTPQTPSTIAIEETGNQRVAKAVGNSCELVNN